MRPHAVLTAAAAVLIAAAGLATVVPQALVVGDSTVHFTAAGDYDRTADTRAVLAKIGQLDPDLNLALGDLSYATTPEQDWCDLVTQYVGAGFPFELLAGNHESNGQNGDINDFSACLPNQLPGVVGTYGRQWYVDVPADAPLVRFVMISPGLTFPEGAWQYTVGSPQYDWTSAAIDGARAASIPWVVVGMHKPCLSVGIYGCESGTDLLNLLLTKKVDLVLSGHEHAYMRTNQLALGPACTSMGPGSADLDCIVDADATMTKGAGTVFATVGTGGTAQRGVDTSEAETRYFAAVWGLGSPTTWGVLDVQASATTLSAAFVPASGGSLTDAFTIAPADPSQNLPPMATFTTTCTGMECAVNGTGSTDSDGSVASYAWSFGDGWTTTGPNTTHRYTLAGTYTVTLTVTDDDGATATTTRTVSPMDGPIPFASDTFSRTIANGLGTADVGGAWRTTGSMTNYSVSGGTARLLLPTAGAGPDVSLPSVSRSNTDLTFTLTTDKATTGSGMYVWIGARRVAGAGEYRATLTLRPNGTVTISLVRADLRNAETGLAAAVSVPSVGYAGTTLQVRVQVMGTSPTTVRARVWKPGTTEPGTWQVTATDSTPALQAAGTFGINPYLSRSATNAPITVRIDDLVAQAP